MGHATLSCSGVQTWSMRYPYGLGAIAKSREDQERREAQRSSGGCLNLTVALRFGAPVLQRQRCVAPLAGFSFGPSETIIN